MPTNNFNIAPSDGWVQIASAYNFIRVSGFPHTHPYYLYSGASAPSLLATPATGSVIFAGGVPTAGQTVTIGSETYTFRAARALPFEVTIGVDATATGANLVTALGIDSQLVTGVNTTGTVALTSKAKGAAANYTLSENADNTTVSGAAMTGGTDPVQGVLMCHHPFKVNVTASDAALFARVVNNVPNSKNFDGKLRLDVFTIV